MIITTTAVGLYDNTSPPVPESTGEAGGFGHLPVTLSLQVVIQARGGASPFSLPAFPRPSIGVPSGDCACA